MSTTTNEEPKSIKEAFDSTEGRIWKDTMVEKMESLHKNETCDLDEYLSGINIIGSKWVLKKKMSVTGQVNKFKTWLVVKEYSQVEGVNFNEIFSFVAKLTSIRVLNSLVVVFDLEIEKMDLKTTFLHEELK